MDTSNIHNTINGKMAGWVDVVIYLSDMKYYDLNKARRLNKAMGTVTIAANTGRPESLDSGIQWVKYEETQTRSEIWNRLLSAGHNKWVLYLVDDEKVHLSDLNEEIAKDPYSWPAAIIEHSEEVRHYINYQMRLVYAFDEYIFSGKNLPDCTRFMIKRGVMVGNSVIEIDANRNPFDHVDIHEEMTLTNYAPQLFLVHGMRLFKEGKHIVAAAQYRKVLKTEQVLSFDKLAAMNGLASCYAEQFKWDQALSWANKSMEEERFQNLPYLIKFKIGQLNKNYEAAYDALKTYYENQYYESIKLHSKASFDAKITIEAALTELIDLAFKAGMIQEACDHLEDLFNQKEGNLDDIFLKKLLVLSIDLSDFEKSEFFFKKLYANKFPKNLSESDVVELNDYMNMFMKNQWFETSFQIYNELYFYYPHNDEFRRRLIVSMVKTQRLEEARQLASKVA